MRYCKQLLCLLLTAVLLLGSLSVPSFAAEDDSNSKTVFSVESKTVNPGETFNVNVDVRNNPGILSATLRLSYDTGLTLEGAEAGSAFSYLTMDKPGKLTSPCSFSWTGQGIDEEDEFEDGTILTLTFTAADSFSSLTKLNISVTVGDDIYDNNLETIEAETEGGVITVLDYMPGDVNGDQRINTKDVVMSRRHVAGGYDQTINTRAVNVNGDQKINSADVIFMRRYIAGGYNVTLLPSDEICDHIMEATPYKAATCTEQGNIAFWHCTICGKYFSDENGSHEIAQEDTIIPANGHTIVIDPAVEPTATQPGLTEGQHCSVCGTVIVAQQEWALHSYTIKYDIANGDNYLASQTIENNNPVTIKEGGSVPLEDIATKGYQFLGWYDGAGNDATKLSRISNADHNMTIYAHWKKITYEIQFYSDLYCKEKGKTFEIDSIEYTIDKGTVLPRPSLSNYVFLAWTDQDGKVYDQPSIPAGTAEELVLTANWTSERNKCYTKKKLEDSKYPIIADDGEDVLFIYEIGMVQNVPLYTIHDFGYISEEGVSREETTSYTTSIKEETMEEYGQMIANATTKSSSWTLSEGWNETTSYNEKYYREHQDEIGKSRTDGRSETGTWNISNGMGGSSSRLVQDSSSTNNYESNSKLEHDYSNGSSSTQYQTGLNKTMGLDAGVKLDFTLSSLLKDINKKSESTTNENSLGGGAGVGTNTGISLGREDSTNRGWTSSGYSEAGTLTTNSSAKDTHELHNESVASEGFWNLNNSYGASNTVSSSETNYSKVTDIVGQSTEYGKSYLSTHNESNTQGLSSVQSDSEEYTTSTVYSTVRQDTVTKTLSTKGTKPGYHRWVVAGTMHVFGVVGYNYETKSYYVNTFSVMDDEQHEFEDYSYTSALYDDKENGVIPFEIPDTIANYVANMTSYTKGLIVNQSTGIVEGYTGDSNLVVIPELYPVYSHTENGIEHFDNIRITGISPDAFRGNQTIQAVIFNDSVSSIPDSAFQDCESLWMVYGCGITSIGNNAFKNCTGMERVFLTADIESLGTDAYEGAGHLYIGIGNGEVAEAAAKSGSSAITMYTGGIEEILPEFAGKTLSVPETTSYFEFNGNNKEYERLSIVSNAQKTVLNKAKFTGEGHLPLRISSPEVVLNQIEVNSKGIAAALTADSVNLGLQSTIEMTTDFEESMLVKSANLTASKEDIVGTLSVSNNLDVSGTVEGTDHLARKGAEIKNISNEKYEALLNASFISLDPNGGECETDYLLLESGQASVQLPIPTRTGYDFEGWYLDDGTQLTDSYAGESGENIVATAKWAPKQFTATWDTGAGKSIVVKRISSEVEGAVIGNLSSGAIVYYGDVLNVTYVVSTGFTMGSKGEEQITVTGNVTASQIYANVTPNQYKVSWNTGEGYSITVKRTKSPYKGASVGNISSGADVYYGDVLSITYTAASGYKLTSKGQTSITVTGNVTSSQIYATSERDMTLISSSDFHEYWNCPLRRMKSHIEIYHINGTDKLYMKGWVYDTTNPSATTSIDVNSKFNFKANLPNSSCPVGGNHGFEGICSGLEQRTMIHTFTSDGNPVKIWDAWINYDDNTIFGVELVP